MGKLTARSVEGFAKRKGRYSDGDGLFLRVLDPGKRAYWTYRYMIGGRERETSLGAFADIKLEQARIKHAELRADVLKKVDPRGDRRTGKGIVVNAGVPTFGAMADKFIAAHEGGWKNRKHAQQWDATLRKYAAPLRDMQVDQIETEHVLACLSPIWNEKPETGSRVRGRIEVVLASAAVVGYIPKDRPNPARWHNWLDLMLANPKKVGKPRGNYKALPFKQGPALMANLAEIDTAASRALQFLILTATRTNEPSARGGMRFCLMTRSGPSPPAA
jgi:Arm DNA-binding domain